MPASPRVPPRELLRPGNHGTTFGGNPVAAVAGLAVIGVIERDGLLAASRRLGDRLAERLIDAGHPLVAGVRGRGLLRGIVLRDDVAPATVERLLDAGWVANAPRPNVIRVAPPLIVTEADIDGFVRAVLDALPAGDVDVR